MRARAAVSGLAGALLALVAAAAPAAADRGHVTDPSGDFPDIVRLDYNNAQHRVSMTLTYLTETVDAHFQYFWLQWGQPQKYRVFYTMREGAKLQFIRADGTPRRVRCPGLTVADTRQTSRVVIPRGCLDRAPDTLRFRGKATVGSSTDRTKLSPRVRRG